MTGHENEPDWTISLRYQPAGPGTGDPEDDTSTYQIICRQCGDHPALDYQEAPAELRQIRGPYPLKAGIAACIKHNEFHDRTDETKTTTPEA